MIDITVAIPEDAGIQAIAGIRTELAAAMEEAHAGAHITLNLGTMKKSDSSLAQLIIAFMVEARRRELTWTIRGNEGERSLYSMLCCDNAGDSCHIGLQRGEAEPGGGAS
ncbi:MAG: hypothetical protein JXM71_01595 [Spirochaetales bacterium]|nr:hypothetical protein [Spirochaetales bacterium]